MQDRSSSLCQIFTYVLMLAWPVIAQEHKSEHTWDYSKARGPSHYE